MKLIVTGGRDFLNRAAAFAALDKVHAKTPITLLIHGACMKRGSIELCGADRWAEEWAREREVPYMGVPAKWLTEGDAAGPLRNGRMSAIRVQGVLALPGKAGTADMCRQAEDAGIRVWKPYGV